eukprot:TRINITY_DN4517_c0_g2_i1.p1 TRINITY_DN4517_c0_g2~~TRINITY_DN4517_c0_g2_i1.p1  ORF type:complete len:248 (-),score=38.90 TRINITY_DN4517_c0_g2_i1:597-1340(-)
MAEANPGMCECVNDFPSYIFAIEITEVLARSILRHANGFKDLLNLSFTCRHYDAQIANLWKKLLFSAFPGDKITKHMLDNKCHSPIRVYWELLKRSRFVTGMEIEGAWTRTSAYYERDRQTEGSISKHPLYLNTVCWLENGACFSDVYPGKYEVIWRVKQDGADYESPVPDAEIFYKKGDNDSWREEVSLGKIYKYNPEKVNQWVEVSTGCIVMEKCGRIHSTFRSLYPNWQGGMWFDCVELKPLPY